MRYCIITMALAALAACDVPAPGAGGPPASPSVPTAENDTCNAAQYARLVGQDATTLERVLILGPVRVLRPNMRVTMDYRPDRINFEIDGMNRISRIFCT